MHNSTDLKPVDPDKAASRVLVAVADHFTAVDPTAVLDTDTLTLAIGAEAYNACGRSTDGRTAELVAAVAALVPELAVGVTRGEFALQLRRAVAESGHQRTEDDNEKVIPSIPRPRTEPTPAAGETAEAR